MNMYGCLIIGTIVIRLKLQVMVSSILPSTTAIFDYVIGLLKTVS